jgi:hypothetical protein
MARNDGTDGFIIIEDAIPEDIITVTADEVDKSLSTDFPSEQFTIFKGVPDEKISEHFQKVCSQDLVSGQDTDAFKNAPRRYLKQLGVSDDDANERPQIVFGQYLDRGFDNIIRWGDRSKVFVTIAMSPEVSPDSGLHMFLPGSHKLRSTSVFDIMKISPIRITLKRGWAVAWTGELGYMWPKGGGAEFAMLVYPRKT